MLSLGLAQCRLRGLSPALSASRSSRRGYRLPCKAQQPVSSEHGEGAIPNARADVDQPGLRKMPYGAIFALSSVGVCETIYLTTVKLTHGTVLCPLSSGCAGVLTSDYANFLGVVPLPILGMLAYSGMAALSGYGLRLAASSAQQRPSDAADRLLRTAVLSLGAVMASCSGFLMYLLATKFQGETCPWCIGSALLSFSIAALAASGMGRRELEARSLALGGIHEAAGPELGLAATTLLLLSLGLGSPGSSEAGDMVLTYKEPVITSESSSQAISLAKRLADAGAKMYGAFWCSHCYDQKADFGSQAMADFPYVECFPEGWQKGVQMAPACQDAGLEGFPTWVIKGQRLVGQQSLGELEEALEKAVEDVAAVGMP